MYEGDGGVTFLVELGSLDLLRANMAAVVIREWEMWTWRENRDEDEKGVGSRAEGGCARHGRLYVDV